MASSEASPSLDAAPGPATRQLQGAAAPASAAATDMMRALMSARSEQQKARALDPAIARTLNKQATAAPAPAWAAPDDESQYVVATQRLSGWGATYKESSRRRPAKRAAPTEEYFGFNSFMALANLGWREELLSLRFRQALVAEFLATALFVATGTVCVMFTSDNLDGSGASVFGQGGDALAGSGTGVASVNVSVAYTVPRLLTLSFMFGLMICVLVFTTGSISGGNLNPAVTLALLLVGKMSYLRAVCYIVVQCAGAIVGAYYAFSMSPLLFKEVMGAANILNPAIGPKWGGSIWTALGGEMIGTALLVFTVCCAADVGRERSNRYVGALTPLMIGFAVLVGHLFLLPVDGCSLNPARSLGSAVAIGIWENHWVFWVGPITGGLLSAALYDYVFFSGQLDVPKAAPAPVAPSSGGSSGPADVVTTAVRQGAHSVALAVSAVTAAFSAFAPANSDEDEEEEDDEEEKEDVLEPLPAVPPRARGFSGGGSDTRGRSFSGGGESVLRASPQPWAGEGVADNSPPKAGGAPAAGSRVSLVRVLPPQSQARSIISTSLPPRAPSNNAANVGVLNPLHSSERTGSPPI